MKKDPRIDEYIKSAAPFARPILRHFRALVHKACPEGTETMKWSFPHFDYHGVMCSMASFKEHCSIGFWKAGLMKDKSLMEMARSEEAMGHLGKIRTLKDLPSDAKLLSYIKEAMQLNEQGVKAPKKKASPRKDLVIPDDLDAGLRKNKAARETFEGFSYSNRKDYVEWIEEAKTSGTREKRLTTTLAWLAEGKIRNWKYAR